MKPTLLIVDDEKPTREGLRAALEERYDVYLAEDAAAATELLEKEHFDVLLTDFRLPNEDGLKLIARARSLTRPPVCILMTAYGSEEFAVRAMKSGADDYIAKGRLQIDELEMRIARALRGRALEAENVDLKQQLDRRYGLDNIIGQAPAMQEVFELVRLAAPSRTNVLVLGESGTGKELIARAIHQLSPRAKMPMVSVHCGGLPAALIEAELFGHEKGAFTGAHERRIGRVEQAQGGTLFLDEIGEIDASTQIKLLRFLGERTFERLGSGRTLTADVRLVAATNKNLAEMVRGGQFRDDLYFRLKGVVITLPSLRQRVSDIPLLAQAFLKSSASGNGKAVREISREAMDLLLAYSWPGNVRELEAAIESAVVLCRGDRILPRDFSVEIRENRSEFGPGGGAGPGQVFRGDAGRGGAGPAGSSAGAAPSGHLMAREGGMHGGGVGGVVPAGAAGLAGPDMAGVVGGGAGAAGPGGLQTVREAERLLIIQALRETGGNRTLAAKRIGMSRRTLHRKLHEYHLEDH